MALWYPVIHPGDRDYAFDLPQRIRARFLSEPRFLRADYPPNLPVGGITGFDFLTRGTDYSAGEIVTVIGGNNDATARVRLVDAGGGAIVGLDFISLGTGYLVGEAELAGDGGSGCSLLILEVA